MKTFSQMLKKVGATLSVVSMLVLSLCCSGLTPCLGRSSGTCHHGSEKVKNTEASSAPVAASPSETHSCCVPKAKKQAPKAGLAPSAKIEKCEKCLRSTVTLSPPPLPFGFDFSEAILPSATPFVVIVAVEESKFELPNDRAPPGRISSGSHLSRAPPIL